MRIVAAAACGSILAFGTAWAGEVRVVDAEFEQRGGDWQVSVTLEHADTGWEHYADAWRILDEDGEVLATRTLHHPHVQEQPFTRSLSPVTLPSSGTLYIEGHDTVHGWSDRMAVDLSAIQAQQ